MWSRFLQNSFASILPRRPMSNPGHFGKHFHGWMWSWRKFQWIFEKFVFCPRVAGNKFFQLHWALNYFSEKVFPEKCSHRLLHRLFQCVCQVYKSALPAWRFLGKDWRVAMLSKAKQLHVLPCEYALVFPRDFFWRNSSMKWTKMNQVRMCQRSEKHSQALQQELGPTWSAPWHRMLWKMKLIKLGFGRSSDNQELKEFKIP